MLYAEKIAIVGAGLAGLTAAHYLDKAKIVYEVFEGSKRVGGRVFSVFMKNTDGTYSIVELGGQNIVDGGEASHILSLIEELGLETVETYKQETCRFFDEGKLYDINELLKAHSFDLDDLVRMFEDDKSYRSIQDVLDRIFPEDCILKRFFAFRISAYEGSKPSCLAVYHNIDTLKSIIFGHIISALKGTDPLIKQITLKEGNAALPMKIAENIKDHLHLNKVLKAIKSTNDKIELTFEDGTKTVCDKVVLALPCTVYDAIEIAPDVIPAERLSEIKRVQYGRNCKIAMPISQTVPVAIFTDQGVAMPSVDRKIINWFSLDNAEGVCDKVLEAFTASGLSVPDEAKVAPTKVCEQQFSKYDGPVSKSWNDSFSKGCYSNFGIDLGDTLAKTVWYNGTLFKALFEPIDDRVFFVGEHATMLSEIGTMEAAVESGVRIGQYIQTGKKKALEKVAS